MLLRYEDVLGNKKEISASELSSYLNNGYSVCSKCNAGR